MGLTRRRLAEQALFQSQPWEPFIIYQETADRTLKLTDPPMQGDDVRSLQDALNRIGMSIKADGIFGAKTDEAVRQFQQQHGLTVDGKVGSKTRRVLGL
ncbi:peptidoglycan-binding domain-containing protein [Leptolyngbya sp. AN02str]|uniref:peptidoglycan-binding domain-containing protein n=1 Tax=Leptolyngbya sp. AN02str TaxID=3423363 RepID=UPI003D320D23